MLFKTKRQKSKRKDQKSQAHFIDKRGTSLTRTLLAICRDAREAIKAIGFGGATLGTMVVYLSTEGLQRGQCTKFIVWCLDSHGKRGTRQTW